VTGYPASEVESRQQRTVAIRTAEEIKGIRKACRYKRRGEMRRTGGREGGE